MNLTLEQKEMRINHHQFSLDSSERERLWEERRWYFKDYCVNRFQWFNYPKWHYVASFPLHVDFEASFRCNLKCPMCFRPYIDKKNYGDMDFKLYKKGIDECVKNNLYSIRLSWRGESTLNPYLIKMVEYAKNKGIKEVSFITNGLLLKGKLAEGLIKAGLDYITVSVDGFEKYYNRLRKPITFKEITEKLKNFYSLKNSIGKGLPLLKIQALWSYIKENPKAFYDYFKDFTDKINFDPENDYSLREVPQDKDFICQYPWQRITITWNGEIPQCISDWNLYTKIGDLRKQAIKEVWLGKAMERYRQTQLSKKRLSIPCCKRCHRPSIEQIGNKPEGEDNK
ncbi:MAG: radical SAM/SPASM domain-containing protein [Candidatus Omnitrophica bacterium]|nr:radical SAM/SPASM domain-containing protein [Candidatus Omnitrophota bacterium]MDD5352662.1 radical SAM/SPASM domain-containing protein [Candidatus Omnitrophota bacterium]MDD5550261.1 radical SAM/SPASM domain-containing protein [Candidatus Omnitrophota bacterium]